MSWREDKITEKQKDYIIEMIEFSNYPLPEFDFKNATKGSASDYISSWSKLSHENTWSIENGYN